MGCSSPNVFTTNLEPYETPIKYNLTLLPVEYDELNKLFKEAKLCLKEFELIRNSLINIRTELIYYTGACCLNNPNLELIIRSFLWIISMKTKGDIAKYQIYFNEGQEPYFSISVENDAKLLNLSKRINEYISILFGLEATIDNINNDYLKIYDDFNINKENYKNSIMSNENKIIFDNNIKQIFFIKNNNIYDVLIQIYEIDSKFLTKFGNLLYDDNYIKQINDIGINSSLHTFKNIQDFIFEMAEENERFGLSAKDGKDKYNILIQQMKSAEE